MDDTTYPTQPPQSQSIPQSDPYGQTNTTDYSTQMGPINSSSMASSASISQPPQSAPFVPGPINSVPSSQQQASPQYQNPYAAPEVRANYDQNQYSQSTQPSTQAAQSYSPAQSMSEQQYDFSAQQSTQSNQVTNYPSATEQSQTSPQMQYTNQNSAAPMPSDTGSPTAPTAAQPVQFPTLDENLLNQLGFNVLPQSALLNLLETMKKTLEMRVGIEIYKHMRDDQLREFEGLMPANDENGNVLTSVEMATQNSITWLNQNIPGWQNTPSYQPFANQPGAVLNFAALNWLQRNFPEYRNVVGKELLNLIEELKRDRDSIISVMNNSAPSPQQ